MLSERQEIDLVFIINANEYHVSFVRSFARISQSSSTNTLPRLQAINAIQCLEAGKHVFIEKPMALSHGDVAAIEATRIESGKVCFVGYMRRYATAFLRVKEAIKGMEVKYVRVRDIIGHVGGRRGQWPSMEAEGGCDLGYAERILHSARRALSQGIHW
jgi:predicted dehydrogenase